MNKNINSLESHEYDELLQKVNAELDKLHANRKPLEENIRYKRELDFEIAKNDLEMNVWQGIKDVILGDKNGLDLENQSPYFFFPPEIGSLANLTHQR